MTRKVVFLYAELAGYFVSCLRKLVEYNLEVHVVAWPVNPEAPFKFENSEGLFIHERSSFEAGELAKWLTQLKPDVILTSGWMDKDYLSVSKLFFGKIPTVLLMDNQWKGTLKQWLGILLDPHGIKRIFSHVWVPGIPQRNYAMRMGFPQQRIEMGLYCADTAYFDDIFHSLTEIRESERPKRFLFVGRYVDFKGIFDLWSVFVEISQDYPEWELWCIGTGEKWEDRVLHPQIKHFGFVQPKDLRGYISNCSFFVLPSLKEPWGVVLHEMAAAGMPLIISKEVGAGSALLLPEQNGFLFESGNRSELKQALLGAMALSSSEAHDMGALSHRLSSDINPTKWCETLLKILSESVFSGRG